MGIVTISTTGSFGRSLRQFSAIEHGHADAVAQAMEYLAADLLLKATAQDHQLHDEGDAPAKGFARESTWVHIDPHTRADPAPGRPPANRKARP